MSDSDFALGTLKYVEAAKMASQGMREWICWVLVSLGINHLEGRLPEAI